MAIIDAPTIVDLDELPAVRHAGIPIWFGAEDLRCYLGTPETAPTPAPRHRPRWPGALPLVLVGAAMVVGNAARERPVTPCRAKRATIERR